MVLVDFTQHIHHNRHQFFLLLYSQCYLLLFSPQDTDLPWVDKRLVSDMLLGNDVEGHGMAVELEYIPLLGSESDTPNV